MATEVTNTENATIIPEHWPREIISALYTDNSLFQRFLNKTQNVAENGRKVNIQLAPSLEVKTVGADGAVAAQAPTTTEVELEVDTHEAILLEWLNSTKQQSMSEWWNKLPSDSGEALREKMENKILAHGSEFTTNAAVGDGAGHADEDMFTAMIGTLLRAKLPILRSPDMFTWAFTDLEYEYVRRMKVLDYQVTGQAGQAGGAQIAIPRLYNIPFFFSSEVETDTYKQNILAHREALATAVQQDIRLETASGLPNRKLTRLFSADVLYGTKLVSAVRGVRGLTAA